MSTTTTAQKPVDLDKEKNVETWNNPSISPAQGYLLAYNLGCALGWNLALQQMGGAFMEGGGVRESVEAVHNLIVVLQLLSTLEFVHGCVGLVSWLIR